MYALFVFLLLADDDSCMIKFSKNIILPSLMRKLESVQYPVALTVQERGGTSRDELYAELGWESLSSRRWIRCLTLFY